METSINGALVSVSRDGELLSSGYTNAEGSITLLFDEGLDVPGTVELVVTSYNKIPYETSLNVIAPEGAYMLMNDVNIVDGAITALIMVSKLLFTLPSKMSAKTLQMS